MSVCFPPVAGVSDKACSRQAIIRGRCCVLNTNGNKAHLRENKKHLETQDEFKVRFQRGKGDLPKADYGTRIQEPKFLRYQPD